MTRRRWIWAGAAALGVALAVAVAVVGRGTGIVSYPGTKALLLVEPTAARLDTIAVDGRRITATLDGVVRQVDEDGTAWLEWDGDAFPLRGADSVRVEDHGLVVGRLRAWRGRRWLTVETWVPVTASVD